MAWPSAQDFREAVQTPDLVFADVELKAGKPEVDRHGLPRPRSGNFASVYRLHCANRDWAVRCFLRDVPDHQERYAAIQRHLDHARLPYTVPFSFLPRGVRISGRWYPILKMEWLQGETLDQYIARQIGNPTALMNLASQWEDMLNALRQHQIAHGDLQHGNIIVVNDQIRLIDYDGMFVPALAGRRSNELGHRHFQHPRRNERDFGDHIDHFAGWVIYLSLLLLAADGTLWGRFNGGGEERLLFRREDFETARTSPLIITLENSPDNRLRLISSWFQQLTQLDMLSTPAVDKRLLGSHTTVSSGNSSTPSSGAWWKDHVGSVRQATTLYTGPAVQSATISNTMTGQTTAPKGAPGTATGSSSSPWLTPISTGERVVLPGLVVGALACLLGVILGPLSDPAFASLIGAQVVAASGFYAIRYHARPEIQGKKQAQRRLAQQIQEVAVREEKRKQLQLQLDSLNLDTHSKTSACHAKQQAVRQKEQGELGKCDAELNRQLAQLHARRDALQQGEANELAQALRSHQNEHLAGLLARHSIAAATIPGIGETMTQRLASAGIRTAGDFTGFKLVATGWGQHQNQKALIVLLNGKTVHVEGVGTKKAQSIVDWRNKLVSQLSSKVPQTVPPAEHSRIRAIFAPQAQQLQQQEGALRAKAQQQRTQLLNQFSAEQGDLARQLQELQYDHGQSTKRLQQEIATASNTVSSAQLERAAAQQAVEGFAAYHVGAYLLRVFRG